MGGLGWLAMESERTSGSSSFLPMRTVLVVAAAIGLMVAFARSATPS